MRIASETPTRTTLVIALTLAVLAAGGELVWRYEEDHRTVYRDEQLRWHHFEASEDRRTLSFVGWFGGVCHEPDRVELSGEDRIVATVHYKVAVRRDGHDIFCTMGGQIGLPPVTVTLDEPLDEDTLVVDGAEHDPVYGSGGNWCAPPREQRVGDAPETLIVDVPWFC